MKRRLPAPPPPSVFDGSIAEIHSLIGNLSHDYRDAWQESLSSPSGQHLHVKVPTTDATGDVVANNESIRDSLAQAYQDLEQALRLIRSARGRISSRRESFDPKRHRSAEGSSLTEQEMAEMESRARAHPSRKFSRAS